MFSQVAPKTFAHDCLKLCHGGENIVAQHLATHDVFKPGNQVADLMPPTSSLEKRMGILQLLISIGMSRSKDD